MADRGFGELLLRQRKESGRSECGAIMKRFRAETGSSLVESALLCGLLLLVALPSLRTIGSNVDCTLNKAASGVYGLEEEPESSRPDWGTSNETTMNERSCRIRKPVASHNDNRDGRAGERRS